MNGFRLSIAGLVALVALFAVAFAALMDASSAWTTCLPLIQSVGLVVAPLGIIYRTGARRAYWLGFALAGWAYLFLAVSPDFVPRLATTRLLKWGYSRMIPKSRQPGTSEASMLRLSLQKPVIGESLGMPPWNTAVDIFMDRPNAPATTPAVENIRVVGASFGSSPSEVGTLRILVTPEEQMRLGAGASDAVLRLERHSESPFAGLLSTRVVQESDFRRVGHAVFGLLAALLGALVGRWFHATGPARAAPPA